MEAPFFQQENGSRDLILRRGLAEGNAKTNQNDSCRISSDGKRVIFEIMFLLASFL